MSVTRAILNRSSARKIFGMFLFSLLSFVGAANAQPKLSFVLKDMGYENIQIDGCAVTFSRRIVPAMKPNNGFAFTQHIFLNSFSDFPNAEVVNVNSLGSYNTGTSPLFMLRTDFDEGYSQQYKYVREFSKYVRATYPELDWPYLDSRSHDDAVTLLEYEMRQFIPNYKTLGRVEIFSKFGVSTRFSKGFNLTYLEVGPLEKFKSAVIEHSKMHSCKI